MERNELFQKYWQSEREHSTATILFHAAVANHFNQNLTDWICAGILQQKGDLSAGQLAELTGLTTGAITGLIDRLEKTGVVRRQPDPRDRRRVMIEAQPEWEEKLGPFFNSIMDMFAEMMSTYSDEELALITDFQQRSAAMMEMEAIKMRRNDDEK